jgi:hypothetical protein
MVIFRALSIFGLRRNLAAVRELQVRRLRCASLGMTRDINVGCGTTGSRTLTRVFAAANFAKCVKACPAEG